MILRIAKKYFETKGFAKPKLRVIDEINTSDDEVNEQTHKPLKSKKKDQNHLIKLMKNSISIGNESNYRINYFRVIVSINNKLDFHQKQTLKSKSQKIQELCQIENKKFFDFLRECNIEWSKSYIYFLISFYNFSKEYPKICNISFSIHFIMSNFKKIKLAIFV